MSKVLPPPTDEQVEAGIAFDLVGLAGQLVQGGRVSAASAANALARAWARCAAIAGQDWAERGPALQALLERERAHVGAIAERLKDDQPAAPRERSLIVLPGGRDDE